MPRLPDSSRRLNIAVIGAGISGLSAAWLLSQRHNVTVFEADDRIGGHSHTEDAAGVPVDTGFIVYNEPTYPNLTALFEHLGVATKASDMSFAVSLDDGRLEYAGDTLGTLFAQKRNILRPRYWSMLRDLMRFYREAPKDIGRVGTVTLGAYLDDRGYGVAFRDDHLYPMAAAIWSTPAADIGAYPAAAFIRFCDNHGLLKLTGRPIWRTVEGGSRAYVEKLTHAFAARIHVGRGVERIGRAADGVELLDSTGKTARFDHAVVASHADQALAMLAEPTAAQRRVLGAFKYIANEAVLHSDARVMPRRRAVWSSWNFAARQSDTGRRLSLTYWMNRLQALPKDRQYFVTLNPDRAPDPASVIAREIYHHPTFDAAAIAAQREAWSLQGVGNIWFCGAHFGAGFHEDGLQSGLAVAEALGGVRRPWTVANESGRIHLGDGALPRLLEAAE